MGDVAQAMAWYGVAHMRERVATAAACWGERSKVKA